MHECKGTDRRFEDDLRIQRNTLERLKGLVKEDEEYAEFYKQIDIEVERITMALESEFVTQYKGE